MDRILGRRGVARYEHAYDHNGLIAPCRGTWHC